MKHAGTICMHCSDGCKTTLGVRRAQSGLEIVRGDNRDKSGINGDFLCIKGRYAFDVVNSEMRLKEPLVRECDKLVPTTWDKALSLVAEKFKTVRDQFGPDAVGVIGSNRITNEEAYLLQKFTRTVIGTNNIDHHRTADFPAFSAALSGTTGKTASMRNVFFAPSMLLIGSNPTDEHPLLAWQIRNNVRLHRARFYAINSQKIKLHRQANAFLQIPEGAEPKVAAFLNGDDGALDSLLTADAKREQWTQLRDTLRAEQGLVIMSGPELSGANLGELVRFGLALNDARFVLLGDYANSHGVADMGLYPRLLPGYIPVEQAASGTPNGHGLNLQEMMRAAGDDKLKALYIVGSNPVARYNIDPFAVLKPFTVVQDMFLTETAIAADVVLPVAAVYEKGGSFTNTCGDLQLLSKASDLAGVRSDFEIIVNIAQRMGFPADKLVPFGPGLRTDMGQSRGAESGEADRHAIWLAEHGLTPRMSPFDPIALLDEIQRIVPGYDVSRRNLLAGNDEHTTAVERGRGLLTDDPSLVVPSHDNLFSSGTLGRYSNTLNSVIEKNARSVEGAPTVIGD
jgi:NADH-quinone oxidoreductase subunit G